MKKTPAASGEALSARQAARCMGLPSGERSALKREFVCRPMRGL